MSNPAVTIIQSGVRLITEGMSAGVFSKEDLEAVKKIFQAGVESTDNCLERGPVKGDDNESA